MSKINIKKELRKVLRDKINGYKLDILAKIKESNPSTVVVDGKIITFVESDEVSFYLGMPIGFSTSMTGIFGMTYLVGYTKYIGNNESVKDFVIIHEIGHIMNGHLDNENPKNIIRFLDQFFQTFLGIGKYARKEFEADEYVAEKLGYKKCIESLEYINKTFYISRFQFLQFRARIKYLKKRMAE